MRGMRCFHATYVFYVVYAMYEVRVGKYVGMNAFRYGMYCILRNCTQVDVMVHMHLNPCGPCFMFVDSSVCMCHLMLASRR